MSGQPQIPRTHHERLAHHVRHVGTQHRALGEKHADIIARVYKTRDAEAAAQAVQTREKTNGR